MGSYHGSSIEKILKIILLLLFFFERLIMYFWLFFLKISILQHRRYIQMTTHRIDDHRDCFKAPLEPL